jgi:predicted metal-binding membrane protein
MNLAWVGLLAVLVLVERTLPGGAILGKIAGIGFAAWGAWLLLGAG